MSPSAEKYDPAVHHDPLFPAPDRGGSSEQGSTRNRSIPSVARGKCPDCASEKTIGLIKQGTHLAWRHHTRRTLSGAVLECRASGVHLCDAPARPEPGVTTPRCRCGTTPSS